MTAAFIEHRPKSNDAEAAVSHYVIVVGASEKHGTFSTQHGARDKAFAEGYDPVYVARTRHLQNRQNPDHFRKDPAPATQHENVATSFGDANIDVDPISNWVETRNDKVAAQVFASKASLLVLPNALAELGSLTDARASQEYFVKIFRAVALSSFAASNPGSDMLSASIAAYKALGTRIEDDHFVAYSASYAAYAASCSDAEEASHFAAQAVNNALFSDMGKTSRKRRIVEDLLTIIIRSVEDDNKILLGLSRGPLWLGRPPRSAVAAWRRMSSLLLERNEGWEVWIDWYNAKIAGNDVNSSELERLVLKSPEDLWFRSASNVNKYLEEAMGEFSKLQKKADDKIPNVPPVAAAAIEPVVFGETIGLPKTAASASLDIKAANAALRSLKNQMRDLHQEAKALGNIDRSTLIYLAYLEELIPRQIPSQDKLFTLAHQLETLESFSKSVNDEWPDIMASRYHSFVRAFDRTIDQFPKWREFRRNFTIGTFGSRQLEAAPKAAEAFSELLGNPEFSAHIDPNLPNAIASLGKTSARQTSTTNQIKEEVAADIIESINNTLKTLASVILSPLHKAGSVIKDVAVTYAANFAKGLRKASALEGEKAGGEAFRWAS